MLKLFSSTARVSRGLSTQTFASFSYAHRCVFLRHGESEWNKSNRFTGWTDVSLTDTGNIYTPLTGKAEAESAGKILKEKNFEFDIAYTSVLTRAIQTYNLAAGAMGYLYLPVTRSWRLNERHYGGLQGLNKSETAAKHGEKQVKIWRRSYDIPPPPLEESDPSYKN